MIKIDNKHLLFIEPSAKVSKTPVVDNLTRKMATALNSREVYDSYFGFHECKCGARSTCHNYIVENGLKTNSLAVHYLMWHRDEVPASELEKIAAFVCCESDPKESFNPIEHKAKKNSESIQRLKNIGKRLIARGKPSSAAKIKRV